VLSTEERNARIIAALQEHMPGVKDFSHDHGLPTKPVGHASGMQTSVRIVRSYRKTHRAGSQNVEPDEVIEVLRSAGVERWVLMGLHGYVGYLPQPRATQDVDVLVHRDELESATAAILRKWPALQPEFLPVVTRFRDPGEIAIDGEMKQVIDLMLPSDKCYEAVLESHYRIDRQTGHRLPVIEAACASKFSAMISPYRKRTRKHFDAGDLRSMMETNHKQLDRDLLAMLGDLIYPGGGAELLEYLKLAIDDKSFPI